MAPLLRNSSGRPRTLAVALLIGAILAAGFTPAAAGEAVSLEEFIAQVRTARAIASQGIAAPSRAKMESIRRELKLPLEVEHRGRRVSLGTDPVFENLRGTSRGEFLIAAQRLDAMEKAATAALEIAEAPKDFEGSLARAYRGVRTEPTLLERVRTFLSDLAARLVGWVTDRLDLPGGRAVAWFAFAVLVVLGLLLLLRVRVSPAKKAAGQTSFVERAADWRALARQAMDAGNLGEAVRANYRALLEELSHRGVVTDTSAITGGECRDAVGAVLPGLSAKVGVAVDAFERAAYSDRSVTVEDFETVSAALESAEKP